MAAAICSGIIRWFGSAAFGAAIVRCQTVLQSIGTRAAAICSLPLPEDFYLPKET
jgi:hypothetical protein